MVPDCSATPGEWLERLFGLDAETTEAVRRSRTDGTPVHSDAFLDHWLGERRAAPRLRVRPVPVEMLHGWLLDPETGNIRHQSRGFFSVMGLKVRHRRRDQELIWDQPIVEQPEFGILGLLARPIGGVLHICLQAKEEPGNIGRIQLSPTLQATYSNYRGVHGGRSPPFLESFLEPVPGTTLVSKLQAEDGGRFLFKSNRNMIVRSCGTAQELPVGHLWVTLRQLGNLLRRDNLVHACTRSVLAPLALDLWREPGGGSCALPAERLGESLQWLDDHKAANHIVAQRAGLNTLADWCFDAEGFFSHRDGRFFRVLGIDVSGEGREVAGWSQPILQSRGQGVIGLLSKTIGGERYFLMQAKVDVGNRPVVQIGPTVQFTPDNYAGNETLERPFLFEAFQEPSRFRVLFDGRQAEEGGRFYREAHLHRILEIDGRGALPIPDNFRWLSEAEILYFLAVGETVNSCARSILSCVLAV